MSKATIISPKVKILITEELRVFINDNENIIGELVNLEDSIVEKNKFSERKYLSLYDFYCLKKAISRIRQKNEMNSYAYEFLEKCTIILPENELIPRSEDLEERCEKLRVAQANASYMKITKNVDLGIKQKYEDSLAFQFKEINRQIIAVVQFVCSVIAGFVFGFLGLQLIIGNLDFGFRLLLGIMCALIIALAEIYFLAKKLNECEDIHTNKFKID